MIPTGQCFPNFSVCWPFLASKYHGPSQPCSVNIQCLDDRHPKLKIYISELILDSYEYIAVAYITMHCMV